MLNSSGTVLDSDGGVQARTQLLRHEAHHRIGSAVGLLPDNQPDRLTGKILRLDRAEHGDEGRDHERQARLRSAS